MPYKPKPKISDLQQNAGKCLRESRQILDSARAEGRELVEEELTKVMHLQSQADTLGLEIRQLQAEEERLGVRHDGEPGVPHYDSGGDPLRPHRTLDNGGFSSFGEWAQSVIRTESPRGYHHERLIRTRAASGTGEAVGSIGGYAVPEMFAEEILSRVTKESPIIGLCSHRPITVGNRLRIPAIDESSRKDGYRWGGIQGRWMAEGELKSGDISKLLQVTLEPKKVGCLSVLTDELLTDAPALGQHLLETFSKEIRFQLESAIVRGSGVGMPLGILKSPALIQIAAEDGQSSETIVWSNLVKMMARHHVDNESATCWLANKSALPQIYSLTLSGGTATSPMFISPGMLPATPPQSLFGYKLHWIESCSVLGSVGDIILADMSAYILSNIGDIATASSIHVRFSYDESVLRAVARYDGQPKWTSACTPYQGTDTMSPFVAIAAREAQ